MADGEELKYMQETEEISNSLINDTQNITGSDTTELDYAYNFANGYVTNIRNAASDLLSATSYMGNIVGNVLRISIAPDILIQAAENTQRLAAAEIKKRINVHSKDLSAYIQEQIAKVPKDIAYYSSKVISETVPAGLKDIVREVVNERESDSNKNINNINKESQKNTINKITKIGADSVKQINDWMKESNDAVSDIVNKYLPLGGGEVYVFKEKVAPMIIKYDHKVKDYCDSIKNTISDLEQNFAKTKGEQMGAQIAEKTIQAARKKQKDIVDIAKTAKRKVLITAKTKIKAALFALLARIGG